MEYRRASRKRTRRRNASPKQTSAMSVVVFFIACAIVITIVCTSSAADWLVEHVIAPVITAIRGDGSNDESVVSALRRQEEITAQPTALPTPTTRATVDETVLERKSYYILQMGCYETLEPAESQALSIRSMGAAGYVFFDETLYRVFAAGYLSADDLTRVQDQIRSDGFDNTAYMIHTQETCVTMTGEEKTLSDVSAVCGWLSAFPDTLSDFALSFDRDGMTSADAGKQIDLWIQDAKDMVASAAAAAELTEDLAPILSAAQDYLSYLSTIDTSDVTMSTVILSANMKYLQLQTMVRFYELTEQLYG